MWLTAVVVHIVLFSTDPGPGLIANIFDKTVMFSCFLLYPVHAFGGENATASIVPFAAQFLFWWLFSFSLHSAYFQLSRVRQK